MNQYRLEKSRIVRGFDRAAQGYEDHAALARAVRELLLDRLGYLALDPVIVLDLGAATGAASASLAERYPKAGIVAVDLSPGMFGHMPAGNPRIQSLCADAAELPLPDRSVDLIFSNLMLPWCDDLDSVLTECRRLIAPHGAFSFSSFGPDTLTELRRAWRDGDDHEHVHAFFDMHDLGDALMRAGFAEPVMDVERFTLTYDTVPDLLLDLRRSGSLNALPGRRRGLVGRGTIGKVARAYETFREAGRLPATYEVVFGQAWGPGRDGGAVMKDGAARIPVDRIGRR